MIHEIRNSEVKKFIGKRMAMSFSDNRTVELWKSFMPRRNEIENGTDTDLYSIQSYEASFFTAFHPGKTFEKWAAKQVCDFNAVPDGMETLELPAGLYVVFQYKGNPADAEPVYRYIHGEWLPKSGYALDDRPHFEILGEKYKNNDPDSEEEIWIPIK